MRAIGVLVALFVVASTASVRADATDRKMADQKFIEGRDLLKADKFEAACTKFHEANKFDGKAVVILLNLGLCYEKQNKIATALVWYRATQTASSEAPDPAAVKDYEDAAKEATSRLAKVVSRITLVLGPLQEGAVITIDSKTIDRTRLSVEVDAGDRVIEARLAGKIPSRTVIRVVDGTPDKPATYPHTFTALSDFAGPSRTKRRVAGVLIAVGVTGGSLLGFGLYANGIQNDWEAEVKINMMAEKPTTTMRIAGGICVGIIAVGLVAGGYLYFSKPKETNRTALAPVITQDQIGLALTGGF